MHRDLPSFSAIKAFEAAARLLSFKAAADELCVTHSAISHQIRQLEDFLGVALFRRETRGVVLTSEGAAYLSRISKVLDQLAAATNQVRDQHTAGPLYVSATPAFAERWLVPRLNDFNHCHPDIELHILTSIEGADFKHDGVDVAIRYGQHPSGDLHAEPFLEASRFPVASPRLLADHPPLRKPGDLRGHVLLRDEVGDAWDQWFRCAGVANFEDPGPGPRFAHCNLTLRAAVDGQGVALGYSALVVQDLAARSLVRLFDIETPSTVVYSLVCPHAHLRHPRIAAFRAWLTTAAALDNARQAATPGLVETSE